MDDKRKAAVNEVHFVAFRLISLSLKYRLLYKSEKFDDWQTKGKSKISMFFS